ncbi:MAG: hypothetical protein AABM64_03255 [Pseudomonadota bacterium]
MKAKSLKTLAYVGDFIRSIHKNLSAGIPDGHSGFRISRHDEGSLFLDEADLVAYTATVGRLVDDFSTTGDLSRRSVEQYLQDSLFHSLDIRRKREKPFDERVNQALVDLHKRLCSPPLSYRCFVPVHGFAPKYLPFSFGGIRFVRFGQSHLRQLLKPIGTGAEFNAFRSDVSDMKESELWGNPCAVVEVKARDFDSAMVRARVATRAAVDSVNFFEDLIPYNHGWLYLPAEGARAREIAAIVSSEGQVLLSHAKVGPIAPFSLENLRKDPRVLRQLLALSALSRIATPKTAGEVLLTSFRWAGRASVEPKREQSFLLFAIALEAAALPVRNQEITYRLSLRVARLLGRSRERRAEVTKSVADLYSVRSKIVHSGSYEVTDEDLGRLRWLTKTVLLRLLRRRSLWKSSPHELDRWIEGLVTK